MTGQRIFTAILILTIIPLALSVTSLSILTQSIRLDESQSLWIATKSLSSIFSFVSQDVHVPLYLVLLHFWVQLFGNSIVMARVLSFIFYLATVPVLYILAREASSRRVAFLTIILFSLSPFIMWYTTETRMYTLFTFITSLNHVFFLRFLRSEGRSSKLGYCLSLIAGFYTHYFFIFVVITQAIFITIRYIMEVVKQPKIISLRHRLWNNKAMPLLFAGLVSTAFCFFIPWIFYVVTQGSASNTQPQIPVPTSFNIIQTLFSFVFGFQNTAMQAVLVSLWPLTVILFFFIFTLKKQIHANTIEYFILSSFLPIFLVFAISFIRPIFLSRYLILVTPTLFFLLAWLLLNASKRLSAYLITLFIVGSFGLLLYQTASANTPVKENYNGVSKYLEQSATTKDVIAVTAPFTVYPIEYTYKGNTKITTIPEWNRYIEGGIPPYTRQKLIEQMTIYKSQHANIYIVFSYDQGYESDIKDYLDRNYEMTERVMFPPGIEVRKYKLRYDNSN